MFPMSDPYFRLDLHRQHVAELIQEAAEYQLARSLRRPRLARWRRPGRREAVARAAAAI
ncbi:hypothetical protein [Actinoplanes sp. NPDC026619]|uniref:hypothetical protein n=1 Tax=Actinoplanes sp. NPDC026619 TaxID=3155798 RepID=UPI003403B8A5